MLIYKQLYTPSVCFFYNTLILCIPNFTYMQNDFLRQNRYQNELNSFCFCFLAFDFLSVLRGHSIFSSLPQRPMTFDFEGFSIPDFIHYIYFSCLNSWERASIFPFECSVLNKGTRLDLDWGLNPGPPALEASIIPLGIAVIKSLQCYRHKNTFTKVQ